MPMTPTQPSPTPVRDLVMRAFDADGRPADRNAHAELLALLDRKEHSR